MRTLHLVRHARSLPDPARPPESWGLDPAGFPGLLEPGASDRVPSGVPTYSSPEPKALATAHVLAHPDRADDPARAHLCGCDAVRRAFTEPSAPAVPEWEPLEALRDRLVPAARRLLARHPQEAVVLVGHGTAWTLLVFELGGTAPDLDAWARLRMPDVWTLTLP